MGIHPLFLVVFLLIVGEAILPIVPPNRRSETLTSVVKDVVHSTKTSPACPVCILTTRRETTLSTAIIYQQLMHVLFVLEVPRDGVVGNETQVEFSTLVGQVRQVSHCMTVVVVSDDPAFLTAFSISSLKGGLLLSTTRFVIITRLLISHLQGLHGFHSLLSNKNSLLIIVEDNLHGTVVSMLVNLPYSPPGSKLLRVATWNKQGGITLLSHLPLFPDKFSKFMSAPNLVVAIESLANNKIFWVNDSMAPDGRRLEFEGAVNNVVEYLAQGMNFTYTYVRPQVGTFGVKLSDGSWDGMMGMVIRKEVDFAPGPFMLTAARAEIIQYTWIDATAVMKVVGAVGLPEVNPWGFLMPLSPLVWAGIMVCIIAISIILSLLSTFVSFTDDQSETRFLESFILLRVLLQQDIFVKHDCWWWERVAVGMWMLTALVLTRSYAGNLMSLLAVRYIPQPYQTLRDVLDDPGVTMIWQKNSANEQYLRTVKDGLFREVAQMEDDGRLMFRIYAEFSNSLRLVKKGDHVIIDHEIALTNQLAEDYSQSGQCNFYLSRESFLPFSSAFITHKDSPLLTGFNKRILRLWDSGLFTFWYVNGIPNATSCRNLPKRILVDSPLAIINLWGIFVVLAVGAAASAAVLCAELLISSLFTHSHPDHRSANNH